MCDLLRLSQQPCVSAHSSFYSLLSKETCCTSGNTQWTREREHVSPSLWVWSGKWPPGWEGALVACWCPPQLEKRNGVTEVYERMRHSEAHLILLVMPSVMMSVILQQDDNILMLSWSTISAWWQGITQSVYSCCLLIWKMLLIKTKILQCCCMHGHNNTIAY